MIHLTQLVYLHPGKESAFLEFEERVLPLLLRYGGELLLRLRPGAESFIAGSLEVPYEVHLIRFDSEEAFQSYARAPERQQFLQLKSQSVRAVLLFKGVPA